MGELKTYKTPAGFKAALADRLRARAKTQRVPPDPTRAVAVMERFLARVVAVFPETTLLKGGLALELRLEQARTTKDIDLRLLGEPDSAMALMERAALYRVVPDDYLTFRAVIDPEHPKIHGDGVVYDGSRFRVTAFLASEQYGPPFGVDVSFADAVHGDPVELIGGDAFAFIGVPPVKVRVYPTGSHIAEKLHAYTFPRRPGEENTRVKDLPELALIAKIDGLTATEILAAIKATFTFRNTHAVPPVVPEPPASWAEKYRKIADDDGLPWRELGSVYAAVRAFVDPVLAGNAGIWDANGWTWRTSETG